MGHRLGRIRVRDLIVIVPGSSPVPVARGQRFIDATKTLLDIANESSDAFPPLKSCLGGINALIKYYEVRVCSVANGADDLADVSTLGVQRCRREPRGPCPVAHQVEEQWNDNWCRRQSKRGGETRAADKVPIISLSSYGLNPIACPRSLKSIEERSQRLLDKGKAARILDQRRDSGAIVKLVEELRQAILLYQVGTIEHCRSTRVNVFWTVVATAVYRRSGHTVNCKFPPNAFAIGTNRRSAEPSRLSTHF